MTKAELVDQVTALGDLTRRDGEVIVDTLFESIINALKANDKVEVRGFGSFRTRQRNSRTGRNPKTGAAVAVPAKRVPFFKPSKELRDLVNPSEASTRQGKSGGRTKQGEGAAQTVEGGSNGHVDPHHPPPM
jgi:integration host factor subunit beta